MPDLEEEMVVGIPDCFVDQGKEEGAQGGERRLAGPRGLSWTGCVPHGERPLRVLHHYDALCLHVDHGLERIW